MLFVVSDGIPDGTKLCDIVFGSGKEICIKTRLFSCQMVICNFQSLHSCHQTTHRHSWINSWTASHTSVRKIAFHAAGHSQNLNAKCKA